MTLVELSRQVPLSTPLVNHAPFVYWTLPARRSTASYWTDTFGAEGEDILTETLITGVTQLPATGYDKALSFADLLTRERSFWWDNAGQLLYIHVPHNEIVDFTDYLVGVVFGYSDQDVVTVGSTIYSPLVRGVPSIAQRADLIRYDRMAFISGSIAFDNVGGQFDDIIDDPIYGNDVSIYYLAQRPDIQEVRQTEYALWSDGTEDGQIWTGEEDIYISYPGEVEYISAPPTYTRDELVPLANLYVENYDFSRSRFNVKVQDKRKAQNSRILTTRTVQGEWVPLLYGTVRRAPALVTDADDATGNVNLRVAESLTSLGTVQVDIDGVWTNRTPSSTNLATGSFVLSAANGRTGGASDGSPLPCRVVGPTGIAITNVADVIVDLNQRVLDLPFDGSVYDLTEWATESAKLSNIGVLFDEDVELFEAIRILQNGSTKGFRYEIRPDGFRTIRVDDFDRPSSLSIDTIDIKDSSTLAITTDTVNFASHVTVSYAKDYNEGKLLRVVNDDFRADAIAKYRQDPMLEFETLLQSEVLANDRALWQATKLSEIRGQAVIELHGQQYYSIRIYDTIDIDFTTESRVYFGKWKCQVIAIDPRFDGLSNRITAILIERV